MKFIARTNEEILAELKSWVQTRESLVEGTFTFDNLEANALEFAKTEEELAELYKQSFGHTATEEYLTQLAAEHGVLRRMGKAAIGRLIVEGQGTVPKGSLFATDEGTRFIATDDFAINGTGIVDIEAYLSGAAGNVAANTIKKIPLNIAGITSCTNPEETYDGYDTEDDETLRERLLLKVRQPVTSGNPNEYQQWAMSIVGVGAARCVRCAYGAGTCKVIIVDSDFKPANDELLERVNDYIQAHRPVGILEGDCHVVSAKPVTLNLEADVGDGFNLDLFLAGMQKYFADLIKKNLFYGAAQVKMSRIGALIVTSGGVDYDYLTLRLNERAADIELADDELPLLGAVNFY